MNPAPTVAELKAASPEGLEGLITFLLQIPTSHEAAIFYASLFAMVIGMVLSWAWKYYKTQETDSRFVDYFFKSSSRRTGATVLSFGAATVTAIVSGVFDNSGAFVGWYNVMYTGVATALGLDLGINQGNTPVWTPAQRKAEREKIAEAKADDKAS